jgi:hypothetical protein
MRQMEGFALIFATRSLLAAAALRTAAAGAPLEAQLAAGGLDLDETRVLSGILQTLGLHSIRDVRLLNAPEQLELFESLRTGGVDLGSRSRLRRLTDDRDGAAWPTGDARSFELRPRRTQDAPPATEGMAEAEAGGSGPSADTLAVSLVPHRFTSSGAQVQPLRAMLTSLPSTACLAIGSLIVQARHGPPGLNPAAAPRPPPPHVHMYGESLLKHTLGAMGCMNMALPPSSCSCTGPGREGRGRHPERGGASRRR